MPVSLLSSDGVSGLRYRLSKSITKYTIPVYELGKYLHGLDVVVSCTGVVLRFGVVAAQVQREGVLFPGVSLSPLRRRAQRGPRHQEVRRPLPGLRRLQGVQVRQGQWAWWAAVLALVV